VCYSLPLSPKLFFVNISAICQKSAAHAKKNISSQGDLNSCIAEKIKHRAINLSNVPNTSVYMLFIVAQATVLKFMPKIMHSAVDNSVNFVFDAPEGYFESRYVRRIPQYFSLYLSSQSGCAKACRMCHLTATKQTKFVNANVESYVQQAQAVFEWYDTQPPAEGVHFDFMARGEALDNPQFLADGTNVLMQLGMMAMKRSLIPRFLISTILPKTVRGIKLAKLFPLIAPEIYYSIYSTDDDFRHKWLPQALPFRESLSILREYQDDKRTLIKLHWAFIKGENDSEENVVSICNAVKEFGLSANLAIVRYNPFDGRYGEESSEEVIDRNHALMQKLLPQSKIKKVSRVGLDVKASCGMFIVAQDLKSI
jgi:23S rRNA (adenine2503-C2)-methyltransferase